MTSTAVAALAASVRLADYAQVDTLGVRYKSVNFGAGNNLDSICGGGTVLDGKPAVPGAEFRV